MARLFVRALSQYLEYAGAVLTAAPLTFACFYRPTDISTAQTLIAIANSGTTADYFKLLAVDGSVNMYAAAGGSVNGAGSSSSLYGPGAFVHLGGSVSAGGAINVYVNGINRGANTTALVPSGLNRTAVGRQNNSSPSQYADGDLAEVAVWSAVLDDDEWAALAKGVSPFLIRPTSLAAYWPLRGADSPEPDRWKTRFDLTVSGTTKSEHQTLIAPVGLYAPKASGLLITRQPGTGSLSFAGQGLTLGRIIVPAGSMALSGVAPIPTVEAIVTPLLYLSINGVQVATGGGLVRVLRASLTIEDIVDATPNTCSFDVLGLIPLAEQDIVVRLSDPSAGTKIFAGRIQTTSRGYLLDTPANEVVHVQCTDWTRDLNRRTVIKRYLSQSATAIVLDLMSTYTTGFTTVHVVADLDDIDEITFTNTDMSDALTQLAKRIGAYWYLDYDKDLHFFVEETDDDPTPLTLDHDSMNDLTIQTDASQVVTRMLGEGGGVNALVACEPGDTLLPVDDVAWYSERGGHVISGPQVLTYTGVLAGGGGGLVGPGAAPTSAPSAALANGSGVESGAHDYAVTFVTDVGESLPGPRTTLIVGAVDPPSVKPEVGTPSAGGGPDPGIHRYQATFVTAVGETTGSPFSNEVITTGVPGPTIIGTASEVGGSAFSGLDAGMNYAWKYTFRRDTDGAETLPSPASNIVTTSSPNARHCTINLSGCQTPPAGFHRYWYRTDGFTGTLGSTPFKHAETSASFQAEEMGAGPYTGFFFDGLDDAALGATAPATTALQFCVVHLTGIPVGPALVTNINLYRTAAGGSIYKYWATIPNGQTTATDTVLDASLGATIPTTNTAAANRGALAGIPLGQSAVTARKLYRTSLGETQLKLLATLSDNATSTYTDSSADASLSNNVPTVDTSGLVQPSGQVAVGATALIVAGTGPFVSTGGWAIIGNGQQAIRYTGVTATALTGIPDTGRGAITASISYNSTVTAAPMLVGIPASGPGAIAFPILKGDPVNVWVIVDDLGAQATLAAVIGGDGVQEDYLQDRRLSLTELTARCDAVLALRGYPEVSLRYHCRDRKTRAGRTITAAIGAPTNLTNTFKIQKVTINDFVNDTTYPLFTVEASTTRFSFEDLLRMGRP